MKNKISELKEALINSGPFHPGKITKQYIKCGKKNCQCNAKETPKKHGPYPVLSYSVGKKQSTVFLKKDDIAAAEEWLDEYNTFKTLVQELTIEYVKLAKEKKWHPTAT